MSTIILARSFLGLLVSGLALVAATLLIGLASSILYVDQLAERGRSALHQAVQVTQTSRRLAALVRELERSARQFAILDERTVPEIYLGLRQQLVAAAKRLSDSPFDAQQRARLERILDIEHAVVTAMSEAAGNTEAIDTANAGFGEASRLAGPPVGNRERVERVGELHASAADVGMIGRVERHRDPLVEQVARLRGDRAVDAIQAGSYPSPMESHPR